MHREFPVADIGIDDRDGGISMLGEVHDRSHALVGTLAGGGGDVLALGRWWDRRSIPASRSGLQRLLSSVGLSDARALPSRSYGLSLSDQYWIRPEGEDVSWEDVNFFDNGFSDDVGRVLFGMDVVQGEMDLLSPDNTSEGNLAKRWQDVGGCFMLLKGGLLPFRQEQVNEVVATMILDSMGVDNARYDLVWEDGLPFSRCEDFVDRDTELVTMAYIMYASRWNVDGYGTCVSGCAEMGVDIVPFLDRLIVADYLIANEDRHLYNFGMIRDASSLEWLHPAPVYDCGASLGYNLKAEDMLEGAGGVCKPFRNSHEEQLGLVSDFGWLDMSRVRRAIGDAERYLEREPRLDPERAEAMVGIPRSRAESLEAHAL